MNLKHYSTLAAAFLAAKNESDAQIQYTDIPDTSLLPNSSLAIDLNGDGIADFKLTFNSSKTHATANTSEGHRIMRSFSFQLEPYGSNEVAGKNHYASVLNCGDTISNANPWLKQEAVLGKYSYYHYCYGDGCISTFKWSHVKGNWLGETDHYVGLRLVANKQTYYGWLRLDVLRNIDSIYPNASSGEIIVKDFAYAKTANTPILPGVVDCIDIKPQLPDNIKICGGDSAKLVVSLPTCLSYQWYKNGEPVANATYNHYTTGSSGQFFVVVSGSGCTDTSNISKVSKYPAPAIPIITTQNDTLFSSLAVTYQWEDSSKIIAGATHPFYFPLENSSYYQVDVTDTNGCAAISDDYVFGSCNYTGTVLNYHDTTAICPGTNITISVSETSLHADYEWYQNGFDFQSGNTNHVTVSQSGLYYADVKWYGIACRSDSDYLYVLSKPTIIQNGLLLTSSSPVANQWLLSGAVIAGATQSTYNVVQPGYYSVEVIAYDNCTIKSDSLYVTITSAENVSKAANPLVSLIQPKLIQVRFFNDNFLGGKIKILNALGQPIKELNIDKNVIEIPFAQNESGWFVVDIEKDEKHFHSPILIF